eukprot:7352940-Prymnesium_polylepis.1
MCHAGTRSDACGPERARVLSVAALPAAPIAPPGGIESERGRVQHESKSDGRWHESKCAVCASGAHALSQSVTGR